MTASTETSSTHDLATYRECIGNNAAITADTRSNIKTSIEAQGGNMDEIAVSMHFHKETGRWIFASAPIE